MTKSALINVRVEPELKGKAEKIFNKLGISISEAISMFLGQVTLHKGLPFDVKVPNKRLRKVLKGAREGKNLISASSLEDLKKQLGY